MATQQPLCVEKLAMWAAKKERTILDTRRGVSFLQPSLGEEEKAELDNITQRNVQMYQYCCIKTY
jgi:hypothetical protein